jgi:hypothetical protein
VADRPGILAGHCQRLAARPQPPRFHPARPRPILCTGPLQSYRASEGLPDFTKLISARCGARLARDTWMTVDRPRGSPALQGEFLFLNRHGRVQLYYAQ